MVTARNAVHSAAVAADTLTETYAKQIGAIRALAYAKSDVEYQAARINLRGLCELTGVSLLVVSEVLSEKDASEKVALLYNLRKIVGKTAKRYFRAEMHNLCRMYGIQEPWNLAKPESWDTIYNRACER